MDVLSSIISSRHYTKGWAAQLESPNLKGTFAEKFLGGEFKVIWKPKITIVSMPGRKVVKIPFLGPNYGFFTICTEFWSGLTPALTFTANFIKKNVYEQIL